jgi:uncharacterized protein YraI
MRNLRIEEGEQMKIRYVSPQKSKLILVAGMIICWAVAGNALEQWDAKTSARVNLRRAPSLSGKILSIIPNGHKVRILQKKGLWCKVDVEGEINGKGWVYARYLEKILPKALKTESSTKTVRIEIASGKQNIGIHPVELPHKSWTEVEEVKPSSTPFLERNFTFGVKGQSSLWNELQDTKNESIALSQLETPKVVKPIHMPPVQPPYSRFKQDAPEIIGKGSSELIEQGDSTTFQKSIPNAKKKHGGAAQETVPTVSEQPMSDPHVIASSVIRLSASHDTKGLTFKRRSTRTVAIALKLVSIVLYCLVVLLLYKGN